MKKDILSNIPITPRNTGWNYYGIKEINWFAELLRKNVRRKLIVWGAGQVGEQVFRLCTNLSADVSYFVDKKFADIDSMSLQKEVRSPDSILDENKGEIFILVANRFYYEIKPVLEGWGFLEQHDFIDALTLSHLSREAYDNRARAYITQWLNLPHTDTMFKSIEIETINRCNNTCTFCPVNINADTREFLQMSETVFDMIIKQLKALKYKGIVSLFSNNEPLLDKRLEGFLKKARHELPDCFMSLFTNGILLSMDRFLDIIHSLDLLYIDNYSDDYDFLPCVKQVYSYCLEHSDVMEKVKIIKRKKDEVRQTRGGQAPNNRSIQGFDDITCLRPFQQLIVRPDGKVSLCCNDAYGKYTLGDLSQQTLADIWYGEEYQKIRERIVAGRKGMELCENCDSLFGETVPNQILSEYKNLKLLTVFP